MKKTLLILVLLIFTGFYTSAKRYWMVISPKHGVVDKKVDIFNEIADSLSSRYSFDFKDPDSAKMLNGFALIIDPVYEPGTKKIDKVMILAHPFVGSVEMDIYARVLLGRKISDPVLVERDSLYYYFSGVTPDFFATLSSNSINEFANSYIRLEFEVREKRRAKERVRIMALPADNHERIKLEKRDSIENEMLEREKRGELWYYDVNDEEYDFTEHAFKTKYSDYDLFVLLPKYDSKNKIVGWLLD